MLWSKNERKVSKQKKTIVYHLTQNILTNIWNITFYFYFFGYYLLHKVRSTMKALFPLVSFYVIHAHSSAFMLWMKSNLKSSVYRNIINEQVTPRIMWFKKPQTRLIYNNCYWNYIHLIYTYAHTHTHIYSCL